MTYGISLDGDDIRGSYGLILGADLKISKPEAKTTWVDVPAINGALFMSNAVTGDTVYKMRTISLTLISVEWAGEGVHGPVNEEELTEICSNLNKEYGGKETQLILPNDEYHYFVCVPTFYIPGGYNTSRIIMEATAQPFKKKLTQTTSSTTFTGAQIKSIVLTNEQLRVVPQITVPSGTWTISKGGVSKTLSVAGTYQFPEFVLDPGSNAFTVQSSTSGTITFVYQEARL